MSGLSDYDAITERLTEYYTGDEIEQWWNSPQKLLGDIPAITVLTMDGGADRINRLLDQLDDCVYI